MLTSKLYVITNRNLCEPKSIVSVVSEILDAGVRIIQLREKDLNDSDLLRIALPISKLCENYQAHLFINANVKIAIDVGAAGIHLPDNDVSVQEVREQTQNSLMVACSTHSILTAKKREHEGADFLTYSPIYSTYKTKRNTTDDVSVGVGNLEKLVHHVNIPVFALGGITPVRVKECISAGASGVAVMSGIISATDSALHAKVYLERLLACSSINH